MKTASSVRDVLARNLDRLMRSRTPRWTQKELSRASGVSQRTVGNMLRGADFTSGATLDRVDAVARVFGCRGWHLILPGLPPGPDEIRAMTELMQAYQHADAAGRELLRALAERIQTYRKPSD